MEDLIEATYLSSFDYFVEYFRDTDKYNLKASLLNQFVPLLKKEQIVYLMEIIDDALDEPAEQSLFTRTINPISTGCLLYKTVHDVCGKFNFSSYNSNKIKEKILN